jgi:ribose-phosphate pyrophosphokinase
MKMRYDHPAGDLVLLAGSANRPLAKAIADEMGLLLWPVEVSRFPDGEAHVQIEATVRDRDAYLIQPTGPPVDENLMELLLLADACRRAGAARVTAVIPYFGYARQDRRAKGREAIGARVVSDLLVTVKLDRVIALDLHSSSVEGFLSQPVEHLTAVPAIGEALQRQRKGDFVVVSPDLGAIKLAERYARILEAPVAVVQKTRLGPEEVKATAVIGDVRGKSPIIVDDMISTGGTIEAAVKALLGAGCKEEFTVAATHGLFTAGCMERFASLPIRRLLVTDSLCLGSPGPRVETVTLAPLFAEAITRINRGQPVSGLIGGPVV